MRKSNFPALALLVLASSYKSELAYAFWNSINVVLTEGK